MRCYRVSFSAVRNLVNLPNEWSTTDRQAKRDLLVEWLSDFGQLADAPATAAHFQALAQFPRRFGRPAQTVREELTRIRDELIPELKARLADSHFGPLKGVVRDAIERLDSIYRAKKRARAGLDFSDLEEGALRLLAETPAVCESVRAQFDHILIDELQDTNRLQWKILDLVRRPERFFGVGDINQSIYGFRHADPEVFREFRDGLEARSKVIDRLKENHRSRAEILGAVDALFAGVEGIEEHHLEPHAGFEVKPQPSVEVIVTAADDSDAAEEREALWIARRVHELQEQMSVPFSAFAVLARKSSVLERIERGFREFRIPALVIGGRTLMESREVRDLVAFLRVLANTRDEISLAGVLRSPLVGIRDETLLRLKQNGDLWPAIAALDANTSGFEGGELDQLLWFRGVVSNLRSRRDMVSTDRLAATIVDETDYEAGLDAHGRRNLERFLTLLRELYEREPRPPAEVLNELEHLRDAELLAEAPPAEAANAVRLMTIHAAKGLEFLVVFVASLHQRTQEDTSPIAFSPQDGIGIRWRDPARQEAAEDTAYSAIDAESARKSKEEEMRLLYVAMTRAKEHLVLSYSHSPGGRGSPWSKLIAGRLAMDRGDFAEEDSIRSLAGVPVRVIRSTQAPVAPYARAMETVEADDVVLVKPMLEGQHDSGAPVTAIGTFIACPRKYYLAHYLGFSQIRKPDEHGTELAKSAVDIGTQVHALLAGLAVESASAEALRLAEVFHSSPLAARIKRAVHVEREFDFVMEIEEIVIRGQIDLWFEEDGELVLVDYKTGHLETEADRLQSYTLQLQFYAIALERLTGRLPDRAFLYFLRSNHVTPVQVDKDSLAAAKAFLGKLRAAQEHVSFPLSESEQCQRCEFYRGLCPAEGGVKGRAYSSQPSFFEAVP